MLRDATRGEAREHIPRLGSTMNDNLPLCDRALRDVEVAHILNVSRRSVHQRAADDAGFPASIRIGRSRRWLLSELLAWMRTKAERDTPPSRVRR